MCIGMNQIQIQKNKQTSTEQKIIAKGFTLASLNHVRQTSNPNIFIVKSQTLPGKKFYRVLIDTELDIITCDCKYFETKVETCKHIIAACFYMTGVIASNGRQVQTLQ
jgi:hypothetical protein